ncbi:MAG: JAB domain-containing protein [Fimbriimonas sp.]
MRPRAARHPKKTLESPILASVPVCRVQLVRETTRVLRATIETVEDAAEALGEHLAHEDREHFAILMLDAKNHLLGIHTVAIGVLTGALIAPREVFKAAILANAASIIVGHNHPSGDPTPSPEDHRVTERLRAAGELLDIPVLDHVVVGEWGKFTSLKTTSTTAINGNPPASVP